MDTSDLQQIVQLISGLGDNATDAFIAYLATKLLTSVLGYVAAVGALVLLLRTLRAVVVACSAGPAVRDILGIGRPGDLTPAEAREVRDEVTRLKAFHDAHA